jgi:hypothetical protein
MTDHDWSDVTPSFCMKCGVRKGDHAAGCLATPNCIGICHIIERRRWAGIKVETLPKGPV